MKRDKIKLWENGTPGFIKEYGQAETTVTPYLLDNGKKNGCVIVCPGGAYVGRAEHECGVVAEMLNANGVSAFTLDYRVFPYKYPFVTEDVLRAVRFVRYNADKFGIDEDLAQYFYVEESVRSNTYNPDGANIMIMYGDGRLDDVAHASDMMNVDMMREVIEKRYLFYMPIY